MSEISLTTLSSPRCTLVFRRQIKAVVSELPTHSDTPYSHAASGTYFRVELPELELVCEGDSADGCMEILADVIWRDACRLIRAFTSDLSEADRHRKWLLLGALDVRASKVDAPPPASYWFLGTVHRDDGGVLWLHTVGNHPRPRQFKLDDALQQTPLDTSGTLSYLAEVRTDSMGYPVGPVISLNGCQDD